jgi:hypothetical protein
VNRRDCFLVRSRRWNSMGCDPVDGREQLHSVGSLEPFNQLTETLTLPVGLATNPTRQRRRRS